MWLKGAVLLILLISSAVSLDCQKIEGRICKKIKDRHCKKIQNLTCKNIRDLACPQDQDRTNKPPVNGVMSRDMHFTFLRLTSILIVIFHIFPRVMVIREI